MMRSLVGFARQCFSRFSQNSTTDFLSDIEYWQARVKKYGRRSVLNIEHRDDAYDRVTADQKARIFPLFESQLCGDERTILDFGCGPGRFTPDLAKLVQGCCIGVDPIEDFLDIAPRSEYAEYLLLHNGVIPLLDSSIDVIWICLVLGGITTESELERTASEINRVLKENGLSFSSRTHPADPTPSTGSTGHSNSTVHSSTIHP